MNKIYFIKEPKETADLIITVGEYPENLGTTAHKGYSRAYSYGIYDNTSYNYGEVSSSTININNSFTGEIIWLDEQTSSSDNDLYLLLYIIIPPSHNNDFSSTSKVIITNLNNKISKTLSFMTSGTIEGNNMIIFQYYAEENSYLFPTTNEQVPIKLDFIL